MTPNPTPPPNIPRWDNPPNQPSAFDPAPTDPATLAAVGPDPYPERCNADQGVSEHDNGHQAQILEFTQTTPAARPVVDTDVVVIGQMTVDEPAVATPHTLHRQQPRTIPGAGRPISRWAVALSLVSHTTVGIALYVGRTPAPVAAVTVFVVLAMSAMLITAEHLTLKARRNRQHEGGADV